MGVGGLVARVPNLESQAGRMAVIAADKFQIKRNTASPPACGGCFGINLVFGQCSGTRTAIKSLLYRTGTPGVM